MGRLISLIYAMPLFVLTPLVGKQLLGTYAEDKGESTFVSFNVPCILITIPYCVYGVFLELNACCTLCDYFHWPILIGFGSGVCDAAKKHYSRL